VSAFAAVFVAAMALVFWPMHQARPRVPHTGFALLALAGEPARLGAALLETARANLAAYAGLGAPWQRVCALQAAIVAAAAVAGLTAGGTVRALAAIAAWAYLATLAVMLPAYPLSDWRAVRQFMYVMPPALLVLAWAAGRAWRGVRGRALGATIVAVIAAGGVDAQASLTRARGALQAAQTEYARFLADALAPYHPTVVIAPAAYRYGWDEYPVTVWASSSEAPIVASTGRRTAFPAATSSS
jgi:hypothetical protein